jgi:3-oxoacid CoA-transferase subunit B
LYSEYFAVEVSFVVIVFYFLHPAFSLQNLIYICRQKIVMLDKNGIAKRIAKEVKDGMYVNLGIGIPTLVANYIPQGINVVLQSENGILGMGPFPCEGEEDADLINAGKQTVTLLPGASIFDSAMSFGMIRSQRIDLTILGAMEVSERGDIANWKIPGKMVKGMGGAMDLVASAKNIIVAMQQVNKHGESKMLTECTLPLTGVRCVKKIVTELGVYDIDPKEGGFILREIAPGITIEQIKKSTAGKLIIPDDVVEMQLD